MVREAADHDGRSEEPSAMRWGFRRRVGGVSPSRGHDGESARRHWTVSGGTSWIIREFELVKTVSSASVSELSTVEN